MKKIILILSQLFINLTAIELSKVEKDCSNGANNKGLNRLGTILMNVRSKIQ